MTIPKELKIGGHHYKVVLTDSHKHLEGALACIDEIEGTIYLDNRPPKSIIESSLIHEILHALNSTLGESEIGHSLIESLSEQIYAVLTVNNLLR